MKRLFAVGLAALISASPPPVALDVIKAEALPQRLSDFRFFSGTSTTWQPNKGVTAYSLNTPLFSDYAEKWRYVWLPPGTKAHYAADGVFEFPVGTAIIKHFGYPADLRKPDEALRLIESRVLLRRATGWVALPYIWDADGKDAQLVRAGRRIPVNWVHSDGQKRSISYAVPNANQCKGCHDLAGTLTPIGPKARNLNDGAQLQNWVRLGLLDRLPAQAPAVPRWDDGKAPLATRARAYLDINCAHCHNPKGPANTSGLWLNWDQAANVNLGLNKRPTAAGRGSGNLDYAIRPGQPQASYLPYRMRSLDPGIAMPELGRATVHQEGVALIESWIGAMAVTKPSS